MGEARAQERWAHTSSLLAFMARLAGNKEVTPRDFNPTIPKPAPIRGDITDLKVFLKPR